MLEMKLLIHGRVQGVGYRYSIIEFTEENQLFVTGFVKNNANGTVEILAHGDIETLKDIRRFASQGSKDSIVRDIEESYTQITGSPFTSFDVIY